MASEEEQIPVEEGLGNSASTSSVKSTALDSTIIAQGLKTLGVHPLEHRHTFLELSLTGLSLDFIDILSNYTKIMYLDISNNNIKSLKPLEKMTCLIHLNARNNQITECLDFSPPLCNEQHAWKDGHRAVGSMLTLVDLSHNKIQRIGDLSRHQFLECLLLSHNQISKIEGLETLEYLQVNNFALFVCITYYSFNK
jgi:Leucine-rich repeat (LRR) protein